ncbi:Rv3654c family TadE-like protein [Streptomyces radiopugnans]|uniref:Helicase/secretion neighborhood TadE-like protein n=1 Tax=Streptomyces radiopugnans TaxID=403935 RepID=A0A1H9CSD6_9ACTN|nr:Rv3654c family TadE-like protein [Streptomyces radiopugnans]URN12782.1 pilus assembly protein TadG-related protein [Streptomyces radiopugnans]SEQ04130.1 helicase/secretion neighborhood TadE-like protein [Streptomyces radiopugnans]
MRNRGDRLPPGGGVRSAERGSATVWAALCGLVLCTVAVGVLGLGQAVVTRHRAGAAADAAALAAADHALRGAEEACAAARRVAAAQGARVVRCRVREEIADLTVRVRAGPYSAGVRARAGPAAAAP